MTGWCTDVGLQQGCNRGGRGILTILRGRFAPPFQMSIIVAKNIPNGARSGQQRMLCWGRYPQRSTLARTELEVKPLLQQANSRCMARGENTSTVGLEEAFALPSSLCIQDRLSLIPGYFSKCGAYRLCRILVKYWSNTGQILVKAYRLFFSG